MEDMAQVLQAQVDCSVQALAPIKQSLAKLTAAEVVAVGKTQIEAINDFINRTMKGLLTEKIDGLTAVTQQMGQVMEGLDPSDFEDKPATAPSLMQRMLGKKEAPVNVLTKYEGLGAQLEQAFIAMTQYKRTLTKNNEDLQRLFDENLDYYRFLAQHEQAFAEREIELERQLVYVKDDFARTTLEATREMISIRRNDFMMARSVSTQLA
ncbi:MAG TPA: toxic anion resistance protein, partial [Metalysinibacillus jejuensis]|nr:toxic anion resistance protein [Metalysinibacillus jejuensis]